MVGPAGVPGGGLDGRLPRVRLPGGPGEKELQTVGVISLRTVVNSALDYLCTYIPSQRSGECRVGRQYLCQVRRDKLRPLI